MSGLGLSGLTSGMNTDAMIEKILQYESRKLTSQQQKKATAEAKQKAWGRVRSSLSTLRSKIDAIRLRSAFTARTATLSDPSVATVAVTAGAVMTTHSLTVTKLAQYHVLRGNDQSDPNSQLNQSGTMTLSAGTTTVNVNVASTDTLNSLRDEINKQAGSVLTAEVVKVPTGTTYSYRLVLTAKTQGTGGGISLSDSSGDLLLQGLGLKKADLSLNQLSAAQDAEFTLNGVAGTSSSNVLTDLVPGLTITLKKAGTVDNTTSITVDRDTEKAVAAVNDWISAFNSVQDLLKEGISYNAETKEKGVLNGDGLARDLQSSLRKMISQTVTDLPDTMNMLSQVGISTGKYGTAEFGKVVLDRAKLKESLLSDEEGVAKLFGAIENNVARATGVTVTASSSTAGSFNVMDLLNGDTDSDRFGSVGGGWESANTPSAASPESVVLDLGTSKTIESVRLFQPDNTTYVAANTGLKDYKIYYWNSTIGDWDPTPLADVTNHQGPFKLMEFAPVTTSKIKIEVSATYDNVSPARLTEVQINARNDGPVSSMYRYLREAFTLESGSLDARDSALKAQIADIDKQVEKIEDQLVRREASLRAQFNRMEQVLAKLQSQTGYIQMIGQMMSSQKG